MFKEAMPPNKCPANQILRAAYTRKSGSRVLAKCIRRVSPYEERYSDFQKRVLGKMTRRLSGYSRAYRGNNRSCGKGFTLRKAYVPYKSSGERGRLVKAACITKRGSSTSGVKIGPIRKGELIKYGYADVSLLPINKRRSALKTAVSQLGSLSVWKKLNVIYLYNKNKNPELAEKFVADRDWVRSTYGLAA
jgi:hypothetical protein